MRRLLFAVVIGLAAMSIDTAPARAQVAGAIGKPLASPDLPAGTISVRVVAGSVSVPIVNTEVTLVVNGTPRIARTDSAGRAQFKDLPLGATVQAKVTDEDKKEVTSDEFPVPSDNGARVMISTKPFVPMGGGGMPNGAMPEPRQMSGEPRPEQSDAPGTYTVRLTYDDFKDAPPVGFDVALVGYTAKDAIELRVAKTDKDGRATFENLDRTGAVSYFAMAQLPRGNGVDRMISTPAVLDTRSGVRLVLSADKRASTEPAVDDIVRIEKQEQAPEAGKVRVTLEGAPESMADVHLMAIHANPSGDASPLGREVAHVLAKRSAPDPNDVQAQFQFQPKADVPAHEVHVQFHGGPVGVNEPIVGASIKLVPAKPKDGAPAGDGVEVKTPTDGYVELKNPSNELLVADITINGKRTQSQPFDLSKGGGYLDIEVRWDGEGKLAADFDVADVKPEEVLVAETRMRNITYRSIPFQPVLGRGTRVTLYIYPRIMFSFSLASHIDDAFLAVSGRFDISNNSWAPYIGGTDGLVIPLPKNFKGAIVGEQDQGDVAVAQGEGYRIGRPIPPGGKQFHGAFSLPVDNGTVEWALDLPLGAFQSGMEILQTPGMSVHLPPSVKGQTMTVPQGTFFVLQSISILPKQSMVMSISNLPSAPSWRAWAPRLAGAATILIMLLGLGFALHRTQATRASDAQRSDQRAKLLEELVELEKSKDTNGKDGAKRRAQITTELESLWDDAS